MDMTLYPAIDVRNGAVVRLRQGDFADETRYAVEPFEQARAFEREGARWLHLVDLDAARNGGYTLHVLLADIELLLGLSVQTGGGVRSADDVERLLAAGAARVVVGSVAINAPEQVAGWLDRFGPERITVALDTRQDEDGEWRLPVHGWTASTATTLPELLERHATHGLRHLLVTDIARDGMLAGPNLALYRTIRRRFPQFALQASGGVRDATDIGALRAIGVAGVIAGRALLDGRLRLQDALSC